MVLHDTPRKDSGDASVSAVWMVVLVLGGDDSASVSLKGEDSPTPLVVCLFIRPPLVLDS